MKPLHAPEVEIAKRKKILRGVIAKLRQLLISEDKAVELIMQHYARRCDPPVTSIEATRLARDVYSEW
jgi:hypothetical protein